MDYHIEDEILESEIGWAVEFEPEEVDQVPALAKLGINADLCGVVKIMKVDDKFFAVWKKDHPELGTFDEFSRELDTTSTPTLPSARRSE